MCSSRSRCWACIASGSHIPTPGVNTAALALLAEQARGTMFGFYDMFSGGNLSQVTIFALGVMPYISASIILQLLTVVWPYLERLSKEGELGRRKITQYTRYLTVVLAVAQSMAIAIYLEQQTNIAGGLPLVYEPGWGFRLMCILTLTTGTMFVMWLGEQITERGIGNGMSLLIFAGIVVNFPRAVTLTFDQLRTGQIGLIRLLLLVALMVAVVAAIVFVERGQRRIVVQYAKRVVGRRQFAGTSTHIPLKVNTGGVIPVIFASSLLAFPATLTGFFPAGGWGDAVVRQLAYGMPLYNLLFVTLILFFAYFYTAIIFNPDDVSENMRKYGGFIPGIRPGKRTAEHIDTILTRITLAGAVYLCLIAMLPEFMITGFQRGADPLHRRMARRHPAAVVHQRPRRELLLRRHVAADRGGRGDGHREPDRVAAHHAALRWLHEEDADSRPSRLRRMGLRLLILGPPGAGKGTQASRIARDHGVPKISTGDMLRDAVASGSPLGALVKETVARGELVSDDLIVELVRARLAEDDAQSGFVLDGFPRTVAQAKALDGLLDGAPLAVVEIRVPDEELVRRVRGRRICERCGTTVSAFDGDPALAPACQSCGGPAGAALGRQREGRARSVEGVLAGDAADDRLLRGAADLPAGRRRPGAGGCVRGDRGGGGLRGRRKGEADRT